MKLPFVALALSIASQAIVGAPHVDFHESTPTPSATTDIISQRASEVPSPDQGTAEQDDKTKETEQAAVQPRERVHRGKTIGKMTYAELESTYRVLLLQNEQKVIGCQQKGRGYYYDMENKACARCEERCDESDIHNCSRQCQEYYRYQRLQTDHKALERLLKNEKQVTTTNTTILAAFFVAIIILLILVWLWFHKQSTKAIDELRKKLNSLRPDGDENKEPFIASPV